ncbi:MAG: XRE family transcriptional regulator [Candidatus Leucobacter sulfamidivorax]|nr:XRE family transcriptional regulator [Candidatus Leucobacter sulfamidivorax]
MVDSAKIISDKVRGVAAEKRFTQQQVADSLGISRTSVVDRFNGRIPFTAPEVFALAIAMEVPVSRFFPEKAGA